MTPLGCEGICEQRRFRVGSPWTFSAAVDATKSEQRDTSEEYYKRVALIHLLPISYLYNSYVVHISNKGFTCQQRIDQLFTQPEEVVSVRDK